MLNTHIHTYYLCAMIKVCQRDTGANLKSPHWPKLGQFEEKKKSMIDYKPKYKINFQEAC